MDKFLESMDPKKAHLKEKIEKYMAIMMEYNKRTNVISRKITEVQLFRLIQETFQLSNHISSKIVIDAGSGNGILGFPIAMADSKKKIILVEPRKKKGDFLEFAKNELKQSNVFVEKCQIGEFFKSFVSPQSTLISRGFPDNMILVSYLKKRIVSEIILITSESKIKKIEKGIEKCVQNTYNVPFRDDLKILHLKNVPRET